MKRRRNRLRDQPSGPRYRPKPRLLVDHNISAAAPVLQSQYHLVISVAGPRDSDQANIDRARAEGLILVTTDNGEPRRVRLVKSPGIVLLSSRLQQDTAAAAALIGTFFSSYTAAGLAPGTPLPEERLRLGWVGGLAGGVLETLAADSQPTMVRFQIPSGKRRRRQ